DMSDAEIRETAKTLLSAEVDGVIATNTTLSRDGVEGLKYADETGGLSGAPVREKSTHVIRVLADALENQLPIIGVGGIDSADAAREKIQAGATLLQIYTSFIYKGPRLIRDIVDAL